MSAPATSTPLPSHALLPIRNLSLFNASLFRVGTAALPCAERPNPLIRGHHTCSQCMEVKQSCTQCAKDGFDCTCVRRNGLCDVAQPYAFMGNGWFPESAHGLGGANCGQFLTAERAQFLARAPPHARGELLGKMYYDAHRARIMQSARTFAVHPSVERGAMATHRASREDLIIARMSSMAKELRSAGRDDFKVEKDKCDMMRFLVRNDLPVPALRGVYRDLPAFVRALRSGEALRRVARWPAFLKACHLTQGPARSVQLVPSAAWVGSQWESLQAYLFGKWALRANDRARAWTEASNALTDSLAPGFMVQEAGPLWRMAGQEEKEVVELKVEVFFGRAYLAYENAKWFWFLREHADGRRLFGDRSSSSGGSGGGGSGGGSSSSSSGGGAPRAPPPPHAEGAPQCLLASGIIQDVPKDSPWERVLADGHLECAWDLAEKAARRMGMDSVRIDDRVASSASPPVPPQWHRLPESRVTIAGADRHLPRQRDPRCVRRQRDLDVLVRAPRRPRALLRPAVDRAVHARPLSSAGHRRAHPPAQRIGGRRDWAPPSWRGGAARARAEMVGVVRAVPRAVGRVQDRPRHAGRPCLVEVHGDAQAGGRLGRLLGQPDGGGARRMGRSQVPRPPPALWRLRTGPRVPSLLCGCACGRRCVRPSM